MWANISALSVPLLWKSNETVVRRDREVIKRARPTALRAHRDMEVKNLTFWLPAVILRIFKNRKNSITPFWLYSWMNPRPLGRPSHTPTVTSTRYKYIRKVLINHVKVFTRPLYERPNEDAGVIQKKSGGRERHLASVYKVYVERVLQDI